MLKCNLAVLLAKKKWKQADLARATGIRPSTISDYYNDMALSIKIEHIDKICYALDCTPADLFSYEKTPPTQYD